MPFGLVVPSDADTSHDDGEQMYESPMPFGLVVPSDESALIYEKVRPHSLQCLSA